MNQAAVKLARWNERYLQEVQGVLDRLDIDQVQKVVERLYTAFCEGRRVFLLGNGGSASTASHMSCDLAKWTVQESGKGFRVLCLNDNMPLISALTNDEGFDQVYTYQLKAWLEPEDVLMIFSVNGGAGAGNAGPWSQNLFKALKFAQESGADVISFTGNPQSPLAVESDISVALDIQEKAFLTPISESVHVVVHHMICVSLRQMIEARG